MTLIPTKESLKQKRLMDLILKLEQENKELVEMLEHVKGYLGSDQREIVESLITKHKQS